MRCVWKVAILVWIFLLFRDWDGESDSNIIDSLMLSSCTLFCAYYQASITSSATGLCMIFLCVPLFILYKFFTQYHCLVQFSPSSIITFMDTKFSTYNQGGLFYFNYHNEMTRLINRNLLYQFVITHIDIIFSVWTMQYVGGLFTGHTYSPFLWIWVSFFEVLCVTGLINVFCIWVFILGRINPQASAYGMTAYVSRHRLLCPCSIVAFWFNMLFWQGCDQFDISEYFQLIKNALSLWLWYLIPVIAMPFMCHCQY